MSCPPTFDSSYDYDPQWNTPEEAKKMADHMETVSPKLRAFMDQARADARERKAPNETGR